MIRPSLPNGFREGGVVAIARGLDPTAVPAIADALAEGGIRAFELTLNDPQDDALRAIQAAAKHVSGDSSIAIGAGTVLSVEAAARAIDAGATFLVSPHFDPEIVGWAVELRGPFPDIPLQPTGGITVDNAADHIRAGAIAVGMGSWLFAGGTPASIALRARQATDVVASARAEVTD